ncbi:MAG TPA: glycosyltransferase family 4 protein [Bryobacteraceae bacterium]|nr:glycosyltransferase family 4 protein [Bryobacteraceae bacterium]HZW96340.1 glycosyltransferase family 4 protein [Candidatus Eremiobacteraceae bacterium]
MRMKILLIGPYPPPHGGVSVHVSGIHLQLIAAGERCRVLDTSRDRPGLGFGIVLLRHAWQGWTLHVHTNGHNLKSWLLALGCGLAGRARGGCILTLHSGMAPGYLRAAPLWRRRLAAFVCSLYTRVICVSDEIRSAVLSFGLPPHRTEIVPACLKTERTEVALDPSILAWIGRHQPLFSTALFFRPEYGFDMLTTAVARLRLRYPSVGCLVMGSGEQREEAERRIHETGLEENVLLLGDVNHDACLALMSVSDVFIRATLEDGDSTSVREALSLGVPVVASRIGTRPPGTILFQLGDVGEMLSKIDVAMAKKRDAEMPSLGRMDRLMEIYQQVTAPTEAYVST